MLTESQRDFIASHPVIRVRYSHFPPFHFQENGKPAGISVELLNQIAASTGLNIQYVHHRDWPEALRAIARQEEFDLLLTAKRTPERENWMAFTQDYLSLPWVIFTRQDAPFISGMGGLTGWKVAVERGYEIQRQLLEKVPGVQLMPVDGLAPEALAMVANGSADAYVGNLTVASYLIGRLGLSNLKVAAPAGIGDHTQAMAVRSDWPELVEILDAGLAAIPALQRGKIFQQWMSVRYERELNPKQLRYWIATVFSLLLVTVLVVVWNRRMRREIRQRQLAEQRMLRSEERYRDLCEYMQSGLAVYEPIENGEDFCFIEFNQAAERINRRTREEVLGQRLTVAFPGVEEFGLLEVLRQVNRDGLPRTHPVTIYADDRLSLWIENYVYRLSDGSIVAIHDDKTVVNRAQEDLEHRTKSLNRAQEIAHIGSWEWNITSGGLIWSDEIYRIFGLQPQQFEPTYKAFLERIHPDDQAAVSDAVNRSLVTPDITYTIEHRVVRPDGEVRSVLEVGEIEWSHDGRPVYMIGTVQDITERKQIEERLLLAREVLQNAGEAIVITDADGVIREVNPAYERIMGYSQTEMVGRKPSYAASGHHDRDFYLNMWQSLDRNGSWEGEIWDRRSNGEAFPQWLTINAIRNSAGEVVNYVGIFLDISRQKAAEEKLEEMAFYDSLTGLPNRTLFHDRLAHGLQSAHRNQERLALLFLDLDRFKNINDTLGHAAGDELLIEVARRLRTRVREADTVARLGGDEFTLIMGRVESPESSLVSMAHDLIEVLNQPLWLQGRELHVGVSIGVAIYPDDGEDTETLLRHADMAMYRAKESGRNNYCFYSPSLQAQVYDLVGMEEDLLRGLERNEFLIHYQPKVELSSGRITGVEALVRWHHPERGMLAPDRFIPVAEESGLIVRLGEWVLREACTRVAQWNHDAGSELKLAVNLSARQVLYVGLLDSVRAALDVSGLAPERLELELTETVVMSNYDTAVGVLNSLRALGVSLAIDDFGTGYSSLSYLKRLPVNTLKIDKSFVQELEADSQDAPIVETIIALAKNYQLNVVAEGIENHAQLDFLNTHRCQEGQGYLFGKPMTEGELIRLLERQGKTDS